MTRGMRCLLLGALWLALAAAMAPGAALAEAGPFWHHRAKGGTGNGLKIEEASPESFNGEGGEQVFNGKISGTEIEITIKSVQAKGIIYNNALQGQFKLLLTGHEPKLVKPALSGCEVKVGENNEIKTEGHMAWKWNGEKKQLEESQKEQKPSGVVTPGPIVAGATKLPEGSFASVSLKGSSCGVLAGTFKVNGSASALAKPANLEEWSTTLTIAFPGWEDLHFWNGKEFVGVSSVGLTFGGNPASIKGSAESKAAVQEIAAFEK
jgi:hypothetical protein